MDCSKLCLIGLVLMLIGLGLYGLDLRLEKKTSRRFPMAIILSYIMIFSLGAGYFVVNGLEWIGFLQFEGVCPTCHEYVDTPYCGNCGTLIIDEMDIVLCPSCGAEGNTPYCEQCGTKLS